jgi:hypothetical protein
MAVMRWRWPGMTPEPEPRKVLAWHAALAVVAAALFYSRRADCLRIDLPGVPTDPRGSR